MWTICIDTGMLGRIQGTSNWKITSSWDQKLKGSKNRNSNTQSPREWPWAAKLFCKKVETVGGSTSGGSNASTEDGCVRRISSFNLEAREMNCRTWSKESSGFCSVSKTMSCRRREDISAFIQVNTASLSIIHYLCVLTQAWAWTRVTGLAGLIRLTGIFQIPDFLSRVKLQLTSWTSLKPSSC